MFTLKFCTNFYTTAFELPLRSNNKNRVREGEENVESYTSWKNKGRRNNKYYDKRRGWRKKWQRTNKFMIFFTLLSKRHLLWNMLSLPINRFDPNNSISTFFYLYIVWRKECNFDTNALFILLKKESRKLEEIMKK